MTTVRPPNHPALRPFVGRLWVSDGSSEARAEREWVLPTGSAHLVFRLSGPPLRLYRDGGDEFGATLGRAVVGGPRELPYLRSLEATRSVGIQLLPGAAEALFGLPASELSGRHTLLDALWGREVASMRERLEQTSSPSESLHATEALLARRLSQAEAPHPVVAWSLERFARGAGVAETVEQSGYSHRHFVELFRRAVGLAPKRWARLRRFQRALHLLHPPGRNLADIALEASYSDQAHFSREFTEFAGMSPSRYLALAPKSPNHVPLLRT